MLYCWYKIEKKNIVWAFCIFGNGSLHRIVFLEEEKKYAVVYATAEASAIGQLLYFAQTDMNSFASAQ